MIRSCQCLQYDIYMRLDFVQEFSLIEMIFYNSDMIVWLFNSLQVAYSTCLTANC